MRPGYGRLCMSTDRKSNEWTSLRDDFHVLKLADSESIEDIFDAQFRRRFSEFIDRATGREKQTRRFARNVVPFQR